MVQLTQDKKTRSTRNLLDSYMLGDTVGEVSFGLETFKALPDKGREFLERLLRLNLVSPGLLRPFLEQSTDRLHVFTSDEVTGGALVEAGQLTRYQLDRVLAGSTHGLVLGNYRILERLGAGSMAVVFLAEHRLMKRRAAVKVLPVDDDCEPGLLERFYGEIDVLADLHHPNVVMAYDAGELAPSGPGKPALLYLVMELVDGGDLEQYLIEHQRVSVAQACDWIRQAAAGLQEAHDHHLIHRDIKPSNLLRTREGQVKVVDFGLARQFCSKLTNPGVLLGSVEFMAPEQSRDPTKVNERADIYGLGATLFWFLTGELPYPPKPTLAAALRALEMEPPRRLSSLRPDAPAELDQLIDRMLSRDPNKRPSSPLEIMAALTPFTSALHLRAHVVNDEGELPDTEHGRRVLVVTRDNSFREKMFALLESLSCRYDHADGEAAIIDALRDQAPDLVIVDFDDPELDQIIVCRRLRERRHAPNLRLILLTDNPATKEAVARQCPDADDILPKRVDARHLQTRIEQALQIKEALDRYERMTRHLRLANRQLESSLEARANHVRQAQDAILFAMAKMAESRDGETAGHLRRLQNFANLLAQEASKDPIWARHVDDNFLVQLERCVPLHDIGKIGLPDQVLSKPGTLDPQERAIVETHTLIGANILDALGREHGALPFLDMAREIVRHHHERYDGRGYPDHLAGTDIPPAARLVAIADVYDALRRKRFHKPALPHHEAARFILEGSAGQFDPVLVRAFNTCQNQFDRIFKEIEE
ncbi:MAG: protein kinase [Gemmataceae bacterium]